MAFDTKLLISAENCTKKIMFLKSVALSDFNKFLESKNSIPTIHL